MAGVMILLLLGILVEVFLHKIFVSVCPDCGTRTFSCGLLAWSCSNPDHGDNCRANAERDERQVWDGE
jgi:hypothetical protein